MEQLSLAHTFAGQHGALMLFLLFLYLLPTYIAFARGNCHVWAIVLLNVLAGWTGLVWAGCFWLSVFSDTQEGSWAVGHNASIVAALADRVPRNYDDSVLVRQEPRLYS